MISACASFASSSKNVESLFLSMSGLFLFFGLMSLILSSCLNEKVWLKCFYLDLVFGCYVLESMVFLFLSFLVVIFVRLIMLLFVGVIIIYML